MKFYVETPGIGGTKICNIGYAPSSKLGVRADTLF